MSREKNVFGLGNIIEEAPRLHLAYMLLLAGAGSCRKTNLSEGSSPGAMISVAT